MDSHDSQIKRTVALSRSVIKLEISWKLAGNYLVFVSSEKRKRRGVLGDCLLQSDLAKLSRSGLLELTSDARFLEMVLEFSATGPARIKLRKVEFWPA